MKIAVSFSSAFNYGKVRLRCCQVWCTYWQCIPCCRDGVLQKFAVGSDVGQHDDSCQWHILKKLLDLIDATPPLGGKLPQVHEHGVGMLYQRRKGCLPGVVVAEEVVDSEATVEVRASVKFADTAIQGLGVIDELTFQSATDEIKEFVRFHGSCCEVGSDNKLHGTHVAPVAADGVEQGLTSRAKRKDPQSDVQDDDGGVIEDDDLIRV
jgi:hypothetical protein